MPYRAKRKRRFTSRSKTYGRSYAKSKKRYTRKRTKRPTMGRIQRPRFSRPIFPAEVNVKLPYFETVLLNDEASSGPDAEFNYSLTSAFDPNISGGGHQPRGYDQWSGLYNNYRVAGVGYKILIRPSSVSANTAFANFLLFGMTAGPEGFQSTNFTTTTDYMEYRQSGMHKWRHATRGTAFLEGPAYGAKPTYFKGYLSNKRIIKEHGLAIQAGTTQFVWPFDYQAQTAASPNAENQLTLWAAALGNGSSVTPLDLPNIQCDVSLVYYVKFWNPKYPASS